MAATTSNEGSDYLSISAERSFPRKVTLPNIYLVEQATVDEWDKRNKSLSFIPVGSLALDFSNVNLRPKEGDGFDDAMILDCIQKRLVNLYHVIGHSKTDGRPECLRIGDHTDPLIPADLPLVPLKP